MCLTTPGRLILTSCEFGLVCIAIVVASDGKLGSTERRRRLEIRLIADDYHILWIKKVYPPYNEPPYDLAQHGDHYRGEVRRFKDIGAAAVYVSNRLKDYSAAEQDFQKDALEHQAADLREELESLSSD